MKITRRRFILNEQLSLIIPLVIFFLLRFPSLFEPNWYGDEGIYQTIGLAMRHSRLLYTGIFDNKPPLLYMVYAFFSGDQFSVRLFSLIIGLCTITVFFSLTKRFFHIPRLSFSLTLCLAILFGLPLIEGNIANAENFMLLPILSAILLLFSALELKSKSILNIKYLLLFLCGVLLAIATLFKIVGVFDTSACFLFFVFYHMFYRTSATKYSLRVRLMHILLDLTPILIGYALPILITVLYFAFHHALSPFLHAVFSSNIGYVGYSNTFIIPQGLLLIKLLLLGLFLLFIARKQRIFSLPVLFILIWLGCSIFNVFFSQRPYTHYMLLVLPSLLLAVGCVFSRQNEKLLLIISLIAIGLTGMHFGFYGKSSAYYANFFSFMNDRKSVREYQRFFDSSTPRDYDIVSFLKTRNLSQSDLFLWGDSAEIYALTRTIPPGRYTVAYHILQYKHAITETQMAMNKTSPEYIVVLPATKLPLSLSAYTPIAQLDGTFIYEHTH